MTRRLALGVACAALLGLTACSQPPNAPEEYGDDTRANFLAGCTAARPGAEGLELEGPTTAPDPVVPVDACGCRYDYLVENVPYDDEDKTKRFPDYDGPTFVDLNRDGGEDGTWPADIVDEIERACGSEGDAEGEGEQGGDEGEGGSTTTTEADEATTTTAADGAEPSTTSTSAAATSTSEP